MDSIFELTFRSFQAICRKFITVHNLKCVKSVESEKSNVLVAKLHIHFEKNAISFTQELKKLIKKISNKGHLKVCISLVSQQVELSRYVLFYLSSRLMYSIPLEILVFIFTLILYICSCNITSL